MESKLINFHLYRYHLLPIETDGRQSKLFSEPELSLEELKAKKNELFKGALDVLKQLSSNYPLKLEHHEGDYYLFKLAQKKTTKITQDFQNQVVKNEPYVYVVINNNPKVQKIAISENIEAFSKPDVVCNVLKKSFKRDLAKVGLNIAIEQMFSSINFWKYAKEHRDEITFINFKYIKPNLADISKSLPNVFRRFAENTNSHESHISIKAPNRGILKNIDKKNNDINGLVEYTSEGAGSISMKIRGVAKQKSTKENPLILKIDEIHLEGASDQLLKMYKEIVKE
ncbi:hypothetical protein [uncultured Draconibacterium sp.]|uniref:hypothetical protein n=1 Tax=uncultured Draconibacterium sp. TaxID=1573823 RepID=UPI002AA7C660|nr:hypothetical protein [uncultured Draconibacterium sp.]